eukprot:TRINITY_DN724_c0_g1_i2.p1 TRINITY_DN724_c0_g1~~TRINITY_DN724_c0_g1_i2.p1  ORF type:complete len:741 (-),score=238.18 TRINITY_DN724_c0_g1_i2:67-2166(-)
MDRNLTLAINTAEIHGVPKLIDSEDIYMFERPDRKTVITYLSSIYAVFVKGEKLGGSDPFKLARVTSVSDESTTCGKCEEELAGECVEWAGQYFHRDCFVCRMCDCKLDVAGKSALVDKKPYCDACAREAFVQFGSADQPKKAPAPKLKSSKELHAEVEELDKLLQASEISQEEYSEREKALLQAIVTAERREELERQEEIQREEDRKRREKEREERAKQLEEEKKIRAEAAKQRKIQAAIEAEKRREELEEMERQAAEQEKLIKEQVSKKKKHNPFLNMDKEEQARKEELRRRYLSKFSKSPSATGANDEAQKIREREEKEAKEKKQKEEQRKQEAAEREREAELQRKREAAEREREEELQRKRAADELQIRKEAEAQAKADEEAQQNRDKEEKAAQEKIQEEQSQCEEDEVEVKQEEENREAVATTENVGNVTENQKDPIKDIERKDDVTQDPSPEVSDLVSPAAVEEAKGEENSTDGNTEEIESTKESGNEVAIEVEKDIPLTEERKEELRCHLADIVSEREALENEIKDAELRMKLEFAEKRKKIQDEIDALSEEEEEPEQALGQLDDETHTQAAAVRKEELHEIKQKVATRKASNPFLAMNEKKKQEEEQRRKWLLARMSGDSTVTSPSAEAAKTTERTASKRSTRKARTRSRTRRAIKSECINCTTFYQISSSSRRTIQIKPIQNLQPIPCHG